MSPLSRKLVRDLKHLRGQAVAIGLLVACAICVYVASTATYHALRETQAAYYARARFGEVFADLRRAPETAAELLRALPGVAEVQTNVVADVVLELPGQAEPATARLVGTSESSRLNRLHLRTGRGLAPEARDEVLASEGFAKANRLGPGDRIAVIINGRRQSLRISGVALSPEYIFAIRPGELMPDDRHFAVLWMDRAALAAAADLTGAFNTVSLTLAPGAVEEDVLASVDRVLAPYGGLQSYPRERHTSHRFVSDEIRQLKAMALVIPAVFLGVAAFLLGVVFSRLVATQRQQIGTLKALGYSDWTVALHFAQLAAAVTLLGGLVGVATGTWLGRGWAALYAQFYRFPELIYRFEWALAAQAAGLSLLATLVGVGGAVRRAVRLPPAAAMLPEPPPTYRRSRLEALGIGRILGPGSRMILRNLTRRPVRTLLSAAGIAAAVAILVVGLFFFDAFEALVAVAFDRSQREDATVTFAAPLPAAALADLGADPGVRQAEGFRAVPVQLHHGHRRWRSGLLGLTPDAGLHQIVAGSGRAVPPPSGGLLLSERLAAILDVRAGDVVEAEVLEGRRGIHALPVTGLVDDLMGVSATMSLPALNDLLAEGPLVSGAFLDLDPAQEQQVFARLRQAPKVAGVTLRSAALASFRQTSAEIILSFAGILILFATCIAGGIVFNTGRISLAERERELATLRVLGFTRGETWRVLAGEIGAHLAIGIPAGCLWGLGLAVVATAVFDSDLFRLPVVVAPRSYAASALIVTGAALGVLLAVKSWLSRLDLVAVLKARE